MTAENADLFNAAAQSYHKDGCTLVVITPRTVPMPRPPPPPPQPYPPDEPHPPAGLDQLQQRRLLDRDGAGNTRPNGGQHNSLLNSLCNAPVDHPPGAKSSESLDYATCAPPTYKKIFALASIAR